MNEKKEEQLILECTNIKNKLEKDSLTFIVKTGNDGKVFGSISSKQISEELKNKGYLIDKKLISSENLNTLGLHNVTINLHKKVIVNLKVILKAGGK